MSDPQQPPRPEFTKHPGAQDGPPPGQQYGAPGQNPQQYGNPGQYGNQQQYGSPGQPLPPYQGGPAQYGPQPLSPQDERTWGMLAHLSTIAASFVALPFLGPLLVFLILKDRSRFVREHAAEALNMNISVIAYSIVLTIAFTIITIVTLGIGAVLFYLLGALGIAAVVFAILAGVAAYNGRPYRYPLIFRLVH